MKERTMDPMTELTDRVPRVGIHIGADIPTLIKYINELDRQLVQKRAKIKRLTNRGIEDMKHRIKELEEENATLYHICRGYERELEAEDFVRVERDRYIELCKREEEVEAIVAMFNEHALRGRL
jgi:tRNA uridine 5-carbamoylmethylation protein Kti12